jgi:hypothetical protein
MLDASGSSPSAYADDDSGLADALPRQPKRRRVELAPVRVIVPVTTFGQTNSPLLSRRAASRMPMPWCTNTFMRFAHPLAKS